MLSQTQLIQFAPSNPPGLTQAQQQRFQNYQQDPYSKSAHLIYFGDPLQLQQSGTLQFSLSSLGADSMIVANMKSWESSDTSEYTWLGTLSNQPGYMSIIQNASERSAFIQVRGRVFNILPIGGSFSVLQEIDGDVGPDAGCEVVRQTIEGPGEEEPVPCDEENNTCPAIIDVLVIVPTDATAWFEANNPSYSRIRLGVETSMRVAISNSKIPRKKVRISKILTNFNFEYPSVDNCKDLLNKLRQQSNEDRERYRADLVLLVTNQDWMCGAGTAFVNDNCQGGIYNCYAFVERPYLIHPRWSAAHELGHLFNMHHDGPGFEDDCPHSAYLDNMCGHGWIVGGQNNQNTIMQTMATGPGNARILHFSNPDVFYNGSPTGTSTANNAKVFRNRGCGVENYIRTATWDVFITAPDEVCIIAESPDPIEMSAHVEQPNIGGLITPVIPSALPITGTPPYTFEWRFNTTGNFITDPGTVFSTTQNATLIPPPASVVFVQLKVTSNDMKVITIVKRISILFCGKSLSDNSDVAEINIDNIRLFPNPSEGVLHIALPANAAGLWQIEILDAFGRLHQSTSFQQTAEQNVVNLDIYHLPPGFYTCQFHYGNTALNAKFLKF